MSLRRYILIPTDPSGKRVASIQEASRFQYGPWLIFHNLIPIPHSVFDWTWHHVDYDGPEDNRAGSSETIAAAVLAIEEYEEDNDVSI